MIHPEDRQQLYAAAAEWRRTGAWGAHEYDLRLVSPGGAPRWVRVFHDIRRDAHGKTRKAFGLILDIDEKKKAELALVAAERAAQAANEAKAQFLANMSHEIRTPMNGVLGVMHVLKRELPAGDSAQLLGEALAAGQMLSTLLDDVIDISRIEAGRLDLCQEAVDPGELVRGVARLLEVEYPQASVTVEVTPQYRNMADGLSKEPRAVPFAEEAMRRVGLTPKLTIVRGGTDGSRLTELGLPTPNLSTGEHNLHSPLEWTCLEEMELATRVLVELARVWGEKG
jgi:signal transduction histidine kinase